MNGLVNAGLCLSFVVLWSSGWIGSKFGVGLTGPFTFLSLRYLLVVVILGLCVCIATRWKRLSRKELINHLLVGFLSHGVFLGASLCAMNEGISAGVVALVTSMQPLFTAILAQQFLGETPSKNQWLGVFFGIAAVFVVVLDQISTGGSLYGYGLLLVAVFGLCSATILDRKQSLVNRRARKRTTPLLQVLFLHSVSALLFFSVFGIGLEGLSTEWNLSLVSTLLYMAVVVSIGSYGLMFLLLRRLNPVKVSSLSYLTPGTTMLMAWFLFNETLTPLQLAGLLLATASVVVIHINNKPPASCRVGHTTTRQLKTLRSPSHANR